MRLALKIGLSVFLVLLLLISAFSGWFYWRVAESLPVLNRRIDLEGLTDRVVVERDHMGVPTIRGETRQDVSRALGFIHSQERFFQMDLLRRQSAGELAELLGEALRETDVRNRIHQFRKRAKAVLAASGTEERALITSYCAGVNAGLTALGEVPFEYIILRADPSPWSPEDTILVLYSMYLVLNDETGRRESDNGVVHDILPSELAEFLSPLGTEWDAPIVGGVIPSGRIPGPQVVDLRTAERSQSDAEVAFSRVETIPAIPGSNNWAVAASKTTDGRAILADDMHLDISVPNTWFRALLEWKRGGITCTAVGVTLPGIPLVIVGSNTKVAWGLTNTGGDWSDLVILELNPNDSDLYLTPDGYLPFEIEKEIIRVRGTDSHTLEVKNTIWGPVIDEDHKGRPRALRWIAHDVEGAGFRHRRLEEVETIEEALEVANGSGIPPQNFVCVDRAGRISWTIEGAIPRRLGFDGRLPTFWGNGLNRWQGWLEPEEYPRVIDPEEGIIWTANARVVSAEQLSKVGVGGYDIGARARQIRDGLRSLIDATEQDMLKIQLDDRALFLERWRVLLLDLLDNEAAEQKPLRTQFRSIVADDWTGHASIDSAGFRLVRAFRAFAFEQIFGWITDPCKRADERFSVYSLHQSEGPLWELVTKRPQHLLDPRFESWEEALLSIVDSTIDYYDQGRDLENRTWGERNTTHIQHPLSRAIPVIAFWLDMPAHPLPGDENMPRVQGPLHGASQRLAVSPGREAEGYFHMPCGQSGHPLSPYYSTGHQDWMEGRLTPFLPGEPLHVLELVP